MTRTQRKMLKTRLRRGLKFHKDELKKWNRLGSLYHIRRDRLFKACFRNIKQEIRLYQRLNAKV